jgi:serine protease AprX
MGVGLVAAKASGMNPLKGTKYYVAMSGTSMATPMTSGVVALLLQANASQTPSQVKSVLEKTAVPLGGSVPNNNYGYGRVNATAALNSVLAGRGPAPTPTPIPGPAPKPTPGGYAVSLVNTFAKYNGQIGRMSYFNVRPGTTIEQEIMLANTGNSDDSYTVTVNGIPAAWYELYGYSGVTMPGDTVNLMALDVTPTANATPGSYHFTVTATSDSDSTISSTIPYTLTVAPSAPAYG